MGLRSLVRDVEEWWFDTTRRVRTAGDSPVPDAKLVVGEKRDSQMYAPVRTANARAALRELPLRDHSEYTFIDVGSGKGRMLFVAAEYPFRKVLGVEYSTELQEVAETNLASYRHSSQRCKNLASIYANAAEFEFPEGNLVLYMFNPFGPEVLSRMLANLSRSLEERPRHVIMVLLWPENAALVEAMPGMTVFQKTRRHHIYQTQVG
ncbi:hypothetical protein BH10ACI4_BH10ACI4_13560 [soil metagenome]